MATPAPTIQTPYPQTGSYLDNSYTGSETIKLPILLVFYDLFDNRPISGNNLVCPECLGFGGILGDRQKKPRWPNTLGRRDCCVPVD